MPKKSSQNQYFLLETLKMRAMGSVMKKLWMTGLVWAVVASAGLVRAEEDTPLGKQMEIVDDSFKALRKEEDASKGAALAREAQQAILESIQLVPKTVEEISDAAEKAKAVALYRKAVGKLFVSFCEIEEAFLANDLEKVGELAKHVRETKKAGHDRFMEE